MKLNVRYVEKVMEKEGIKTQAELAARLEVNRSTISRALAGGRVGHRLIEAFRTTFPDSSIDRILEE